MNTKLNILKSIEEIYTQLSNSNLAPEILLSIEDSLTSLADYLNVEQQEAMIFALVFSFQITDSTCDYKNVAIELL